MMMMMMMIMMTSDGTLTMSILGVTFAISKVITLQQDKNMHIIM